MSKNVKGRIKMKKILIVILILLFVFAFIRITTSTYENLNRGQKSQELSNHYKENRYEF